MVPEWRREIVWRDRLGDEAAFVIDADAAERAALARRFGIEALKELTATLTVTSWRKSGVKLEGRFHAVVRQRCVVTFEPIETVFDEAFERCYLPPQKLGHKAGGKPANGVREVVIDPEKDEPDVLEGARIDAGEVVAEALALAIDPYPRKKGAVFSGYEPGETGKDEAAADVSPFSALAKLKNPY